jgi:hypothetical protein
MPDTSMPPSSTTLGRTTVTRRVGLLLAVSGLVAILTATLFPNPGQAAASAATPLLCILCGESGGTDVFLNLLLFAPMAAGLRLFDWRWRRVVVLAALLSFTVEFLQFAVVAGRDPSLSDLLTNTTGAAVAAALAPHLGRLITPAPSLARRLCLGAAAVFLVVLTLFALGFEPSLRSPRLHSDCTQFSGAVAFWTGTLRSVELDGYRLPCDRHLSESAAIVEALVAGNETLRIDALSGIPTRGRAIVYTVRAAGLPALTLWQDGNSAVFSVPTGTQRLQLSPLSLQLPKAFPLRAGIPLELRAGQQGRRMWISSSYSGQRRSAEVTLSPSFGWTSLALRRLQPGAALRMLTALWLGGLIFPAGYWAGFIRQRAWTAGTVTATLVAGLGLLPALTGYPPAHWSEWLGGFLGAILGWALHWSAAYLQSRCGSPSISAYSSP